MARSLEAFPVSDDGFSLPVNDVLTGRGFVTGKSGSGKSNTASVIAEELLERGLGLMIVDTDGEYHGLKERYEMLHVGADEQCDRQVNVEDAGFLADLALEENVPIILDVSAFMDEDESKEIIHAVVKELFVMEKARKKPFLLFVEEAHEFIPEQGGGDDLTKMLIRVAKRGRKRGLGVVAMSQRPAAVSKDYITQCDWLIWHRLTWENDTKVAGRILGGDARESIQTLDTGEAMVMTDWDESIRRVQFRRKKTVDAGSTPTLQEAYGPPGAREDHLATDTHESGSDDESADEGDAEAGDADDPDADDPDAAEGPEPAGDPEGADDVDDSTDPVEAPDQPPDPGSVNEPDPDERLAVKERVARRAAMNQQAADQEPAGDGGTAGAAPPAPANAARPELGGGAGGAATADAGAGGSAAADAGADVTRRFQLDDPDDSDPIWELGQALVYGYGVVVGAHVRFVRWLERGLLAGQSRTRELLWGAGAAGTGRIDHVVARAISRALLVGVYVGLLLALFVAVFG